MRETHGIFVFADIVPIGPAVFASDGSISHHAGTLPRVRQRQTRPLRVFPHDRYIYVAVIGIRPVFVPVSGPLRHFAADRQIDRVMIEY